MIKHRTFQTTHLMNVLGRPGMDKLEELRADAERFAADLPAGAVISVTETRDQYASTVTVWYRSE
jgi:hypothetical protein